MADISKIGSRIRDVRLSRGMSQSALAEKANISLPHPTVIIQGPRLIEVLPVLIP